MATNSATEFEGPMDPTDFVDFVSEFGSLLEPGETIIAGFDVTPTTEAAALGFEISSAIPPSLEVGDENVLFWSQVNIANQQDAVFDNNGVLVEVEITVTTTLGRIYERTFLIRAKQL